MESVGGTLMHLGPLHGFTYVLALGPWAVLGLTVFIVRHRDIQKERDGAGSDPPASEEGDA